MSSWSCARASGSWSVWSSISVTSGPAGPGSAAATCRGYRPLLYGSSTRDFSSKHKYLWPSRKVKHWFPASGGRGMSVRAPHSSSLLMPSLSQARMAENRTGTGTLDVLGSAPRSSSSSRVFKYTSLGSTSCPTSVSLNSHAWSDLLANSLLFAPFAHPNFCALRLSFPFKSFSSSCNCFVTEGFLDPSSKGCAAIPPDVLQEQNRGFEHEHNTVLDVSHSITILLRQATLAA